MNATVATSRTQAALDAAAIVGEIAMEARKSFVGREDVISALAWCVVSGEHALLMGPPGTAKSALVRFWADAMGRDFFRRVLNPDTTREDLIGPIDPSGLRSTPAVWERAWAGLATCDFALLDEVGKASNQVLNMLLDAMEERRVTSGNIDRPIPLHLAVGATNETLGEEVAAVWDRFTVRIVVGYLSNSTDFVRLLTDTNRPAPQRPLTRDDLIAMRDEARAMAARPSQDVQETMVKLWSRIGNQTTERVSDRRWKKLLVVAAGRALLFGRSEIDPQDLIVGAHMIWSKLEEREALMNFVRNTVDEEAAEISATEILVKELEDQAGVPGLDLREQATINVRIDRKLKELSGKNGRPEWDQFRTRLRAVKDRILEA